MVTTREIADDNSSISSTRWAFATVVKFDIAVILITIGAGIAAHFMGKPLDNGFYGSVSMLLGILTGLATATKALQGFEPKHREDETKVSDAEVEVSKMEKLEESAGIEGK
jgi:hypothetical protein